MRKSWGLSMSFWIFLLAFTVTWLTLNLFSVRAAEHTIYKVIDGDTLILNDGEKIRLLGINAPDKGEEDSSKAKAVLTSWIGDQRIWIEEDRYSKDPYGRKLAWVWVGCESEPQFKPANYMAEQGRLSGSFDEENPMGCTKGLLVNEQMIRMGLAQPYFMENEGRLKYEERLKRISL